MIPVSEAGGGSYFLNPSTFEIFSKTDEINGYALLAEPPPDVEETCPRFDFYSAPREEEEEAAAEAEEDMCFFVTKKGVGNGFAA